MKTELVLDFLRKFIETDHQANIAEYTERDDNIFQEKVALIEKFYAVEEGVYAGFHRSTGIEPEWFDLLEETGKLLTPRVLFMVIHYTHPELGDIYRAYVSGRFDYDNDTFDMILTIIEKPDKTLRIVSVDAYCLSCCGRGRIGEEGCESCDSTGWEHASGRQFEQFGHVAEVYKLVAPQDAVSLASYQLMGGQ